MILICAMVACTQEEVNKALESAKLAQKLWAKVPLWKRAEALHRVATLLKNHKNSIAECLVKEIAKPSKDAVTEVASYIVITLSLFHFSSLQFPLLITQM